MRTGGELLDGLLDRGLLVGSGESVLGVEDDVRGVERLLREAVLDGVGRALRLRAGQAEPLVVAAAVRELSMKIETATTTQAPMTRHGWRPAKWPMR